MQPLITVKRDNIQHDNDIDENLCFLGFSNALYLVDAFICFFCIATFEVCYICSTDKAHFEYG